MENSQRRLAELSFLTIVLGLALFQSGSATAQPLQTVNMAVPARSFQMVLYPIAQQKGYMKEEGLDQRVIFVAPTTSIQAMLGGDVQFTGAGTSALVSIARGNTPLKVVAATNDRVLQWFVTRPEITSPKDLKGKKIATTGVGAVATFMLKQVLTNMVSMLAKTSLSSTWGRAISSLRSSVGDLTQRCSASSSATSASIKECAKCFSWATR